MGIAGFIILTKLTLNLVDICNSLIRNKGLNVMIIVFLIFYNLLKIDQLPHFYNKRLKVEKVVS